MSRMTIIIMCSLLLLVSIGFYVRWILKNRETAEGNRILANASQLTFSAFIFGYALILISLNAVGMSNRRFIMSLFFHATFVSLVNVISILYYEKVK